MASLKTDEHKHKSRFANLAMNIMGKKSKFKQMVRGVITDIKVKKLEDEEEMKSVITKEIQSDKLSTKGKGGLSMMIYEKLTGYDRSIAQINSICLRAESILSAVVQSVDILERKQKSFIAQQKKVRSKLEGILENMKSVTSFDQIISQIKDILDNDLTTISVKKDMQDLKPVPKTFANFDSPTNKSKFINIIPPSETKQFEKKETIQFQQEKEQNELISPKGRERRTRTVDKIGTTFNQFFKQKPENNPNKPEESMMDLDSMESDETPKLNPRIKSSLKSSHLLIPTEMNSSPKFFKPSDNNSNTIYKNVLLKAPQNQMKMMDSHDISSEASIRIVKPGLIKEKVPESLDNSKGGSKESNIFATSNILDFGDSNAVGSHFDMKRNDQLDEVPDSNQQIKIYPKVKKDKKKIEKFMTRINIFNKNREEEEGKNNRVRFKLDPSQNDESYDQNLLIYDQSDLFSDRLDTDIKYNNAKSVSKDRSSLMKELLVEGKKKSRNGSKSRRKKLNEFYVPFEMESFPLEDQNDKT